MLIHSANMYWVPLGVSAVVGMMDTRVSKENTKNSLRVGFMPYSSLYLGSQPFDYLNPYYQCYYNHK